jgi:site-specific DNA-methyltransferase (adenine-specific)
MELTLHNGDCLEVMKTIPDKSIDLIICDLPYGCLAGTNGKQDPNVAPSAGRKIVSLPCTWDVKIDLKPFWDQIKRIRKSDHSPCIHFCSTKFGYEIIKSNESEFRYDLVWDKQRGVSFLSANKMPMRSHEMIYVFAKAGAFYTRVDEDAPGKGQQTAPFAFEKTCVKSVIQIKKAGVKTRGHPTEKPESLYRFLIDRYCPAGGTVLDPTFGSGNSVFTAFAMGRSAIGIEKDQTFFEKAVERLNALP